MFVRMPGPDALKRLAMDVSRRFLDDGCTSHAAALTYTTLFAIVPMLTVTYSMLSAIPSFQGTGERIQEFVFAYFMPSAGEAVSNWLSEFSRQARNLTVLGMAFLLVTALMMLRTIDVAINRIFRTTVRRRAVTSFLLYWAILTLGPLLLGLGFVATSYLTTMKMLTEAYAMIGAERWFLRVLPFLLSTAAFTLLYMAVPNRRVRMKYALIGGLITAFLFEIAKGGFTLFLSMSPTYEFIYGAFAAVPIFLVWIYLSWLLVLLGAVIVHSLACVQPVGNGLSLPPGLAILAILSVFEQRFAKGKPTGLIQVHAAGWRLGQDTWDACTEWLLRERLICTTSRGGMILAQSPSSIETAALLERFPWPLPGRKMLEQVKVDQWPVWFERLLERLSEVQQEQAAILSGDLEMLFRAEASEADGKKP